MSSSKSAATTTTNSAEQAIREDEARVDSIIAYLRYSIVKTKTLPSLLVHLILVIFIMGIVYTQPMYRELFDFEEDRLLATSIADAVSNPKEVMSWFEGVVSGLYELRKRNATRFIDGTVPIGLVTFHSESKRSSSGKEWLESCTVPSQLKLLNSAHYADLAAKCDAGDFAKKSTDVSFPFSADYNESAQNATMEDLLANAKVDDDTTIIIHFFLYSANVNQFVTVTATYDQELGRLSLKKTPFWFHDLSERKQSIFELIAWIIIGLCCLHILAHQYFMIRTLSVKALHIPAVKAIGVEQAYDLAVIIVIATTIGYYSTLLHRSLNVPSFDNDEDLHSFLVRYTDTFHLETRMLAWCSLLIVLRTMTFFKFWTRFNVVNETIISSIPSLIGCTLIFFAVVMSYSVTAKHLFGNRIFECRTFYESLKFLMILVFREGSLDYTPFNRAAPVSSPIFFLSFAFLAQVVILNIVVGVLASSFSAAVATMELVRIPNWSWRALLVDMKKYIARFFIVVDVERDVVKRKTKHNEPIGSGGVEGEPVVETEQQLLYIAERLELLEAVMGSGESNAHLMSARSLQDLAPNVRESTIRLVVFNGRYHVGTSDAVARQSKTATQAMHRHERMEGQLWRQARMVQDLHSAIIGVDDNSAAAISALNQHGGGGEDESDTNSSDDENSKHNAKKPSEQINEVMNRLGAKTRSVSSHSDGVVSGLVSVEEKLTQMEATIEMLRNAAAGVATRQTIA